MKLDNITEITKWFNDTDLVEFEFKKGDLKLNLVKEGENKGNTKISSNLSGIYSPEVGIFRLKNSDIKKDKSIKKGEILGFVLADKKKVEVSSGFDGRIKVVCVNDGDIVEYSQLLFIVE